MAVLPHLALSLGKILYISDFMLSCKVNDKEGQEWVNNKVAPD